MSPAITLPRSNKGLAAWARNHGLPGARRGESFKQYRSRLKLEIANPRVQRIATTRGWIAEPEQHLKRLRHKVFIQGDTDPATQASLDSLETNLKRLQTELAELQA